MISMTMFVEPKHAVREIPENRGAARRAIHTASQEDRRSHDVDRPVTWIEGEPFCVP